MSDAILNLAAEDGLPNFSVTGDITSGTGVPPMDTFNASNLGTPDISTVYPGSARCITLYFEFEITTVGVWSPITGRPSTGAQGIEIYATPGRRIQIRCMAGISGLLQNVTSSGPSLNANTRYKYIVSFYSGGGFNPGGNIPGIVLLTEADGTEMYSTDAFGPTASASDFSFASTKFGFDPAFPSYASRLKCYDFRMYDFGTTTPMTLTQARSLANGDDNFTANLERWYTGSNALLRLHLGKSGAMVVHQRQLAEATVDLLAGQPRQFYLIHDALAAGASVVHSADSQFGPRIGVPAPASTNHGSFLPTVIGDPDDDTDTELTFNVVRGGGVGTAEWAYRGANDEWYGANAWHYSWGNHPVRNAADNGGGVIVYSSAFNRVVVLTAAGGGPGTGEVRIAYIDRDERPQTHTDWTTGTAWNPIAGVSSEDAQPLAACETRDGTLIALVRNAKLTSSNQATFHDYDVYRSIDGGLTWNRACERLISRFGTLDDVLAGNTMIRIASSGDWLRICYWEDPGAGQPTLNTLVSADGGVTWKAVSDRVEVGQTFLSTSDHDELPFDLVGIDDKTGTFICAYHADGTPELRFIYASRDGDWAEFDPTPGTALSSPHGVDLLRSIFFLKTPHRLAIWVVSGRTGGTGPDEILFGEVPLDQALTEDSWTFRVADPFDVFDAMRYRPMQSTCVWAGDRGAWLYYIEDSEDGTPDYATGNPIPYVAWLGGWSNRPWGLRQGASDQVREVVRWDWTMGSPGGGGTGSGGSSSTDLDSQWSYTTSAGGTFTWLRNGILHNGISYHQWNGGASAPTNGPDEWDPDFDDEQRWLAERTHISEFVFAAGQTFSATPGIFVGMAEAPSLQNSGEAWRIYAVAATNAMLLYDGIGATTLATIPDLDIQGSWEAKRFFRARIVVSPATTLPTFMLQARDESGGDWKSTAGVTLDSAVLASARHRHRIGCLDGFSGEWIAAREMKVTSRSLPRSYADPNFTTPRDLAGAVISLASRAIGAGSTNSTPTGLRVAWSGGSGSVGDSYAWELEHEHAVEHAFSIQSPQYPYLTAIGATAGSQFVLDAQGGNSSTPNRWAHNAAAVWDARGATTMTFEYATDAAFTASITSATIDFTQHAGLTVDTTEGNTIRVNASAPAASLLIGGSLTGRYLKITAVASGAGRVGHVHKISRHRFDGDYHHLELSNEGQFDPDIILNGDTFAVLSNKGFVQYASTFAGRRYMRVTMGASGENSWDGRFGIATLVVGIARRFDPVLTWAHTDTQQGNTTLHRSRGGSSWGYRTAPSERRIVARWIGDVEGNRREFRAAIDHLAGYQEQPIALVMDVGYNLGEEEDLVLTNYDGNVALDEQAYTLDAVHGRRQRPVGDMQVFFREVT